MMPKCVITVEFEMHWSPWEDDRDLFADAVRSAVEKVADTRSMTIDVEFPGSVVAK